MHGDIHRDRPTEVAYSVYDLMLLQYSTAEYGLRHRVGLN
jgi:hypothetical protein